MTRISVGVHPRQLCDQMLRAEHREIKRIPNTIINRLKDGKSILMHDAPKEFKLGKGHVKFFYNKIAYLHARWIMLDDECERRGFKMQDYTEAFVNVPCEYYGDWECTDEAKKLVVERIEERIDDMKSEPKYYSNTILRSDAKKLLK